MSRWWWVSMTPLVTMSVLCGLTVFDVPPTRQLWLALLVGGGALYVTAAAWGYPLTNWSRYRQHLERTRTRCRHEDWTAWLPMDNEGREAAWCRGCGWVLERRQGHAAQWRFRAGLSRHAAVPR